MEQARLHARDKTERQGRCERIAELAVVIFAPGRGSHVWTRGYGRGVDMHAPSPHQPRPRPTCPRFMGLSVLYPTLSNGRASETTTRKPGEQAAGQVRRQRANRANKRRHLIGG